VRATGRVRFAPCSMSGQRILGDWRDGAGHVLHDGCAASIGTVWCWR
jgi:hypothetical protein